ncbi:GNAT family N-acetyltransferase [Dermacoccaceae bacterium W4C1]
MLRPATEDDLEPIRRWRNHPEVQAVSLQRHEVTPQMHAAWWAAVSADPSRLVLIYERGERPCGVVTFFDIEATTTTEGAPRRSAMWGYYLDNAGLNEIGALLPAWMQIQREAVRYADTELDLDVLEGEVLEHNEAVRRMNLRNGFVEVGTREQEIDGEPATVHLIRRERPTA